MTKDLVRSFVVLALVVIYTSACTKEAGSPNSPSAGPQPKPTENVNAPGATPEIYESEPGEITIIRGTVFSRVTLPKGAFKAIPRQFNPGRNGPLPAELEQFGVVIDFTVDPNIPIPDDGGLVPGYVIGFVLVDSKGVAYGAFGGGTDLVLPGQTVTVNSPWPVRNSEIRESEIPALVVSWCYGSKAPVGGHSSCRGPLPVPGVTIPVHWQKSQ